MLNLTLYMLLVTKLEDQRGKRAAHIQFSSAEYEQIERIAALDCRSVASLVKAITLDNLPAWEASVKTRSRKTHQR